MQGRVTANRLNVRQFPNQKSKIVNVLSKNYLVNITGEFQNWFEICFQEHSAYLAKAYIEILEEPKNLQGKITANKLNIRQLPNLSSAILGTLQKNAIIDILNKELNWLEIAFNGQTAYVHKDYVDIIETATQLAGQVTAHALNVRNTPDLSGEILGTLAQETQVMIQSSIDGWHQIDFNDQKGYISGDFVQTKIGKTDTSSEIKPSNQIQLIPETLLTLNGSSRQKKIARTWNQFGGLLETLSGSMQLDPACAVAVFCVESSGKGFQKSNQDRMIIRFENHVFWKTWGKENPQIFHQHFKYGKQEDGRNKIWLGHQFRPSQEGNWKTFHGSQSKEWEVLDFAKALDESAALTSISMGAPQIMGFHYKRLGFESAKEMFNKFNKDIQYQIEGFYHFMSSPMIQALQENDFITFAELYNGSGQKEKYGNWIQEHYQIFKELQKSV